MWNQHRSCSPLFQSFSAPDGSFRFHFHSTGFRKVIARSFSLCCQQLFWIYTIIYHDCNIIANAFQEILLVKATSFLLLVLDKKPPKIPPNMGRIVSGKAAHSCWPSICPAASTQKSTFPYICIANKGKCFCLAHYEVTIAKDTVNSQ